MVLLLLIRVQTHRVIDYFSLAETVNNEVCGLRRSRRLGRTKEYLEGPVRT